MGLIGKAVARKAIAVMLGALSLLSAAATAAQATDQVAGRPGSLYVYPVLGRSGDVIQAQTPYAYRAQVAGAQTVFVRYFVFRENDGALVTPANPQWIARSIPSNAPGVYLPGAAWDVTASKFRGQFTGFTVYMQVLWNTSNGGYLGERGFTYDRSGDYRCVDYAGYYCMDGDSIWFAG